MNKTSFFAASIVVMLVLLATGCGDGTTVPPADAGADAAIFDGATGDTGGVDAARIDGGLDAATVDASACDGICTAADTACPSDCALCVPGTMAACYDGPSGTMGVGLCAGGMQTCAADGASFGACLGEVTPTLEDCTTTADEDCDSTTPACGALLGGTTPTGTGSAHVAGVAAANGRVAIVGDFSGSVDFGAGMVTSAGSTDAFVAVYDNRAIAWVVRFGDAAAQSARGVALDATGGVVVTGNFAGSIDPGTGVLTSAGLDDVFLVAFDHTGTASFAHRYGDTQAQTGRAIALDATGIVIVGDAAGAIDFGGGALTSAGGSDAFVAMLDPTGNHLLSRRFGGVLNQAANAVALDAGHAYVVGSFAGSTDFGTGTLTSNGATDVFVLAMDRAGVTAWSRGAGGTLEDAGLDVAVSADQVAVGGSFAQMADFGTGALTSAGSQDAFVALYGLGGAPVASHRYGDAVAQGTSTVALDASDTLFLGGRFVGTIDLGLGALTAMGASNAFVGSLDPAGAARFGLRFGTATASTNAIALDGSTLVAVGDFTSSIDLGAGPIAAGGGGSFFVAYLPR